MDIRLVDHLKNKYPLFWKKNPRLYFEVGNGWFNIIDKLLGRLYSDVVSRTYSYEDSRRGESKGYCDAVAVEKKRLALKQAIEELPYIEQVKEKFGTLRFYADNVQEKFKSAIYLAESMSGCTCEVCGNYGSRATVRFSWIMTLCDFHKVDENRRDEEKYDSIATKFLNDRKKSEEE